MRTKAVYLTGILAALVCARPAHAVVVMTLEQVGPNVVATGSGTVNLTGLSFDGFGLAPYIFPGEAVLLEGNGNTLEAYGGIPGPTNFGSGLGTFASTGTGDPLAIEGTFGEIGVPFGYVSGAALSSTATFDNITLAGLGVTDGIYTWTWGSGTDADSLTLYAGVPAPTSVPEPAPALLLTLAAAAFALLRRRSSH